MKAILTAVAAAALVTAGAFAQVQTGEPTNGSKLGVTPPPSTSVTTDTSRLATDCDKPAADARANQAGGAQVGNCGSRTTTTMGASGATVGTTAAAAPAPSSGTAMSSDTGNTDVAQADTTTTLHKKGKKAHKARADRG